MHLSSLAWVCGVQWVIPKGTPTAGNVWPLFTAPIVWSFLAVPTMG